MKQSSIDPKTIAILPSSDKATNISISPNSSLIMSYSKDKGEVIVWNLKGEAMAKIKEDGLTFAGWAMDS